MKALTLKSTHSIFMERTRNLHRNHTALLNKQLFRYEFSTIPKEQRKKLTIEDYISQQPEDRRAELPFSLEFLRDRVTAAIGQSCPYCRTKLTLKNISLDHQIPVTRRAENGLGEVLERCIPPSAKAEDWFMGGKWYSCHVDVGLLLAAFSWSNVVICCLDCNRRKGDMTAEDFRALLASLDAMTEKSALYVRRQLALKAHWFGKAVGK